MHVGDTGRNIAGKILIIFLAHCFETLFNSALLCFLFLMRLTVASFLTLICRR